MKRTRQPFMRPDPRGTRADRPDLGPDDRSATVRAWKSMSALVRWVVLVVAIGVAGAGVLAILLAALFTLVDSSI